MDTIGENDTRNVDVVELLELFAQGVPPSIGGEAGWVGTGLLGGVLSWLMFWHVPNKDKQIEAKDKQLKEWVDAKDAQIISITQSLTNDYRNEIANSKKEFKEALNLILAHCEKENRELNETVRNEISKVHTSLGGGQ